MSNSSQIATDYLSSFWSGDVKAAHGLIAENFSFAGPFVQVEGKDAFFNSAVGLIPIMRGYRLLRQWDDGGHVCTFYEFNLETPVGKGAVLAAERNHVHDGQIASVRLVFDTAQFRKLVPATRPCTSG